MASLKKILSEKGFQVLQLERTLTDHFAILGVLNGVRGRFILDTGASNTCVSMDRAEQFGMQSELSEVKAAGAGAVDMETHVSAGNHLQLGAWECSDLQVVLFDMRHVNQALGSQEEAEVDGILGADLLHRGRAVIDYHKERLYLK